MVIMKPLQNDFASASSLTSLPIPFKSTCMAFYFVPTQGHEAISLFVK
jgi:hypothetical protein